MEKALFIKLIDYFGECYVYDVNEKNISYVGKNRVSGNGEDNIKKPFVI